MKSGGFRWQFINFNLMEIFNFNNQIVTIQMTIQSTSHLNCLEGNGRISGDLKGKKGENKVKKYSHHPL
jgi:hypothetical protein